MYAEASAVVSEQAVVRAKNATRHLGGNARELNTDSLGGVRSASNRCSNFRGVSDSSFNAKAVAVVSGESAVFARSHIARSHVADLNDGTDCFF